MDPQVIPLAATAAQTLGITLAGQVCRINVYTKHIQVPTIGGSGVTSPPQPGGTILTAPPDYAPIDPVFLDLYVSDILVLGGVLSLNNVKIVRGFCADNPVFAGDLSFTDTQGNTDPQIAGLGSRWLLLYWP